MTHPRLKRKANALILEAIEHGKLIKHPYRFSRWPKIQTYYPKELHARWLIWLDPKGWTCLGTSVRTVLMLTSQPCWNFVEKFTSFLDVCAVQQSMAQLATETPEWLRADQIEAQFGLRPSYLRKLAKAGKIKMKLLRAHARSLKGVRLYHVASIRALIEQQPHE